ncbi:hypothetical protein H1R20_g7094, partial [Candolleomyces eurysporus]
MTFVYRGLTRKLVIAFDLGTTFSGVSYSVLDPGETPDIRGVTRFPAHEQVNSGSKIPSIIYYNEDGRVKAVGAEAMQQEIIDIAKEEGWEKAECMKSAVDVASDFFRYLFNCTKEYIQESHANGSDLWESVKSDIDFVISHPNGWGGFQQGQLRQALAQAGLIEADEEPGNSRVSFITEGEASLHFALRHGLPPAVSENGEGVIIVDGGGGTIDISTYRKPKLKTNYEEIAVSEYYLSESEHFDDIDHIVSCFDKTTKVWFSDDQQPQYIRFGSTRDNDPTHNIRFGQLKLQGSDVATFFQPSIDCITETVEDICKTCVHPITHVVFVGGFSASEWLYKRLAAAVEPRNLQILRPQVHPNKAVSDGAVSSYLNGIVTARIARYSYGVLRNVEYDPKDSDHINRADSLLYRPSGRKLVPNAFEVMLAKGTKVSDETEVSVKMWKEVGSDQKSKLENVPFTLYCYKAKRNAQPPKFFDQDSHGFSKLCSVQADLSNLPLQPLPKGNGIEGEFYRVKYSVVLLFNSAELKAHIRWEENGVQQRTQASVVFFDDS